MQLLDQSLFAPLSGNVALDLAVCALAGMFFFKLAGHIRDHVRGIRIRRARTQRARLRLQERSATISSLQEELIGARGQTQSAIGAYLEDVDNRNRVSAAAQDRERDPEFSKLEEKLAKAAAKPHSLLQR
ncbi:MAG: hypothetical protein RL326_1169 [Pseudomonadota bacterium]